MPGKFEFAYNLNGDNADPAIIPCPVAAAQTLAVGDLVIVSGGQITKASASVAAPFGIMAQASAAAAANTLVRVYPIVPGQVWHATASASAAAAVLGAVLYDITAAQLVDIADAANGSMAILETRLSNTDVYVTFSKGYFN